jgi:hypothetical protein
MRELFSTKIAASVTYNSYQSIKKLAPKHQNVLIKAQYSNKDTQIGNKLEIENNENL